MLRADKDTQFILPNGSVIRDGVLRSRSSMGRCYNYLALLSGMNDITIFDRRYLKSHRVRSIVQKDPCGKMGKELYRWWQLPLPDGAYELHCRPNYALLHQGTVPWSIYFTSKRGNITIMDRNMMFEYFERTLGQKRPRKRRAMPKDRLVAATQAWKIGRKAEALRIVAHYFKD